MFSTCPFAFSLLSLFYVTISASFLHSHHQKDIANGVDLRILPLGDSITWGEGSSDSNGYRLALSNLITHDKNNNLSYIGSVKSGTMSNNENEGHGGFTISAVGQTGVQDYPLRPNVVLFMAGTNDVVFDVDLANAPKRVGTVIEEILSACPDATVLVGTLLPLIKPDWLSKIKTLNSAIPGVVSDFAKAKKHVALVDMGRVNASHIQGDGIHPTDEAYALIAAAWYDALIEVGKKDWIKTPLSPGQIQPSPDANQASKPIVGNVENNMPGNDWPQENPMWNSTRLAIYALLTVGFIVIARKAAIALIHRYKS
ncbi:hypothetical protein ACLMJK_004509 [Lecanora helva]